MTSAFRAGDFWSWTACSKALPAAGPNPTRIIAPALVAYMNGHDHRGGYAEKSGVHYVTFSAMVEHDTPQSCNVVDVYSDRLVLRNAGSAEGQQLKIRPAR